MNGKLTNKQHFGFQFTVFSQNGDLGPSAVIRVATATEQVAISIQNS
jgi:hypothetical protein